MTLSSHAEMILTLVDEYASYGAILTKSQVHSLFPYPITGDVFNSALFEVVRHRAVIQHPQTNTLVKRNQYDNYCKLHLQNDEAARKRLLVKPIIEFAKRLSWVKLLAITGSCALESAQQKDDIDFFTITAQNRLFMTRALMQAVAVIFGLRRKRGAEIDPNKACFNLWVDEQDMEAPAAKQTRFAAHQFALMRVVINRENTYQEYLHHNKWIFEIVPNVRTFSHATQEESMVVTIRRTRSLDIVESIVRALQMLSIGRHTTHELILPHQLWFHPLRRQETIAKNTEKRYQEDVNS